MKLSRPLDFLVVADHSDDLGFFPQLMTRRPDCWPTPPGRKWYDMIKSGQGAEAAIDIVVTFSAGKVAQGISDCPGTPAYRTAWQEIIEAAGGIQRSGPLHGIHRLRVDLEHGRQQPAPQRHFPRQRRQGQPGRAVHHQPPLGSDNPGELWKWMAAYEEKTGGEVLAIAHNGNLSNGRMFPTVEAFGKKIDREYVETRARWERLYEATQTKGDGEAHPFLSPNDEFADFEIWDKGNLDGSVARHKDMLAVRVCPLGAEERPEAGAGARRQSLQVRPRSAAPTRTPASPRWRRTTSSARPRRRSRAPSA